jgi:uncharacterized Zn-binding protein involved in type VI secretion
MGIPSARIGDMHTCPELDGEVPHVGGPIVTGANAVLINGQPAARIGDMAVCIGPPDSIATGASNVLIAGSPVARIGDSTDHGGVVVTGSANVMIANGGGAAADAGADEAADSDDAGGLTGDTGDAGDGDGLPGGAAGEDDSDGLTGDDAGAGESDGLPGDDVDEDEGDELPDDDVDEDEGDGLPDDDEGEDEGDGLPDDDGDEDEAIPNTGAAPGSINMMGSQDQFLLNATNRQGVDPFGYLDVVAHGNAISIVGPDGQLLSATDAANMIAADPQYVGQNIRLLSCSTGSSPLGFAQQLSNDLGVTVIAPTDTLWAYPDGSLTIGPTPNVNSGSFATFNPSVPR